MQHEFIWQVDADTWDRIAEYTELLDNLDISQHDYIDKLRALGMPAEARPGANLRVVRVPRRTISLPTTATFAKNGVPLPGLPH